jgi:hypothetical protein
VAAIKLFLHPVLDRFARIILVSTAAAFFAVSGAVALLMTR